MNFKQRFTRILQGGYISSDAAEEETGQGAGSSHEAEAPEDAVPEAEVQPRDLHDMDNRYYADRMKEEVPLEHPLVVRLIGQLMKKGKKATAERILRDAFAK